ncbi:MAG: DUF1572 family protein [Ferruginibacter sp.]
MHTDNLLFLYTKDLNRLKAELEQYKSEKNIWAVDKGIANSAGNLCLHLLGNLNHFIGAELGHTGYTRQRDLEFSQKNVPSAVLLQQVDETIDMLNKTLRQLSQSDYEKEYPQTVLPAKVSVEAFLFYLTTHLAYHLGQVNYHRRLLDAGA